MVERHLGHVGGVVVLPQEVLVECIFQDVGDVIMEERVTTEVVCIGRNDVVELCATKRRVGRKKIVFMPHNQS